jgi:predicted metal-dependent hydrolase
MQIAYDVVFSKRRTISLIVERDNRVVVRAPEGTTDERISRLIEQKKFWLYEKTQHPRKYPTHKLLKELVPASPCCTSGITINSRLWTNP